VFRDQVAVVAGASSGLGRELALVLAGGGAKLVLAARREAALQETAGLMASGSHPPLIVPTDLSHADHCRVLIERTKQEFGRVDHLVLATGLGMWSRLDQVTDPTLFEKLIAANYLSAVYCTHAALPHLRESGGLITAISSLQGKFGVPLHTGYAGAKHALHGFFDSLRLELEPGRPDILMVLPHWVGGTELRGKALGPKGVPMGPSARQHRSEPMPAAEAARRITQAMQQRKRELVLPERMRWFLLLNRLAPGFVAGVVRRRVEREDT
jgi:NAD(P)-dependent dehydrogenase (short-subunit alcohol dehydrogenase family)